VRRRVSTGPPAFPRRLETTTLAVSYRVRRAMSVAGRALGPDHPYRNPVVLSERHHVRRATVATSGQTVPDGEHFVRQADQDLAAGHVGVGIGLGAAAACRLAYVVVSDGPTTLPQLLGVLCEPVEHARVAVPAQVEKRRVVADEPGQVGCHKGVVIEQEYRQ
jgi:hypothetical protein